MGLYAFSFAFIVCGVLGSYLQVWFLRVVTFTLTLYIMIWILFLSFYLLVVLGVTVKAAQVYCSAHPFTKGLIGKFSFVVGFIFAFIFTFVVLPFKLGYKLVWGILGGSLLFNFGFFLSVVVMLLGQFFNHFLISFNLWM